MSTTRTQHLLAETGMEVMRILHSAFRRDGARLNRAAEQYGTHDPAAHEAQLIGWHGMSSSLHHHHMIEDSHIWPVIRDHVDGTSAAEVLDATAEEHARIDPAIEPIEQAFSDPSSGAHDHLDRGVPRSAARSPRARGARRVSPDSTVHHQGRMGCTQPISHEGTDVE